MEFWDLATYVRHTWWYVARTRSLPRFWSTSEYVGRTLLYTGRTPLGRNIDFWTLTVDFDFEQG